MILGNLITDAMVNYWVVDMGPSTTGWTDAAVAIYPSAGIAGPSVARGMIRRRGQCFPSLNVNRMDFRLKL